MSGRPANPSYAVLTWDTGNYPAGSNDWNGTAKRVAPGGTYISPTDGAGAQIGNYLWGAGFDVDISVKTALTNLTNFVGQSPAMTWAAAVTTDATKALNKGAFSVKEQAWYATGGGGNDWGMVSYDYGRSWTALTLGSSIALLDVACDASGNVLLVAAVRDIYFGTFSVYGTVSFAHTATALSAAPSAASVTYDSTNSKWIVVYRTGTSGMRIDTSSNGTTFAAQTIPASWSGYTGSAGAPHIHCSNGTTVASFYDDNAALIRIIKSTNGGTTWTDVYDTAPSFTPQFGSVPTCDTVNTIWYITYSEISPSRKTEVLKSTDGGATWTIALADTANDFSAVFTAALGTMIVAIDDIGRMFYSLDGVSWLLVARNPATTGTFQPFLRAGGGGFIVLAPSQKQSFSSARYTADGQAV